MGAFGCPVFNLYGISFHWVFPFVVACIFISGTDLDRLSALPVSLTGNQQIRSPVSASLTSIRLQGVTDIALACDWVFLGIRHDVIAHAS